MSNGAERWLVETEWLASHLDTPGLVILDGSMHLPTTQRNARAEYLAAHIPGALFFDIEDASAIDKDKLTADLNALIAADHPVSERWISDAELEANPGLVRTMAVRPATGTGKVRLVMIGEGGSVDLQPCGGTHVKSTAEIGRVAVTKIEKKGKLNRRIRVSFA